MEQLYQAAGLSRQAFHQWMQPSQGAIEQTPVEVVLQLARFVRKNYLPGCGVREVYHFIRKTPNLSHQLVGWGKHSFEKLCLNYGLRIISRRFIPKTTIRGHFMYPNLIAGRTLTAINQVWVSDICYIFGASGQLLGYATTLIDIYSRYLLGLSFSQTMRAVETSQVVLQQALKQRKIAKFENTIFHSDGGKQYIEKQFVSKLRKFNIQSSMAYCCYENAFAEAFNDTLKNHMLTDVIMNSFAELKKQEQFIKKCYNQFKPHTGINRLTPLAFEEKIRHISSGQRTTLLIKVIA